MYRLMKSKKYTVDHLTSGLRSFYRQTQVEHFQQFRSALSACEVANNNGRSRYYLLNELGQEYYRGSWID
jgi:ferritin